MQDILMTIKGIFIAAILMFIVPVLYTSGKVDELFETTTQIIVNDFVNDVTQERKNNRKRIFKLS